MPPQPTLVGSDTRRGGSLELRTRRPPAPRRFGKRRSMAPSIQLTAFRSKIFTTIVATSSS